MEKINKKGFYYSQLVKAMGKEKADEVLKRSKLYLSPAEWEGLRKPKQHYGRSPNFR